MKGGEKKKKSFSLSSSEKRSHWRTRLGERKYPARGHPTCRKKKSRDAFVSTCGRERECAPFVEYVFSEFCSTQGKKGRRTPQGPGKKNFIIIKRRDDSRARGGRKSPSLVNLERGRKKTSNTKRRGGKKKRKEVKLYYRYPFCKEKDRDRCMAHRGGRDSPFPLRV